MPGMRGPSRDSALGSGFPNSCTILKRSFSSSCRRIISSKARNCSCSACCCFIKATRFLSSSNCCCKAKFRASSSSFSFCKTKYTKGHQQTRRTSANITPLELQLPACLETLSNHRPSLNGLQRLTNKMYFLHRSALLSENQPDQSSKLLPHPGCCVGT